MFDVHEQMNTAYFWMYNDSNVLFVFSSTIDPRPFCKNGISNVSNMYYFSLIIFKWREQYS